MDCTDNSKVQAAMTESEANNDTPVLDTAHEKLKVVRCGYSGWNLMSVISVWSSFSEKMDSEIYAAKYIAFLGLLIVSALAIFFRSTTLVVAISKHSARLSCRARKNAGDPHPYGFAVTRLRKKANITATRSQYHITARWYITSREARLSLK